MPGSFLHSCTWQRFFDNRNECRPCCFARPMACRSVVVILLNVPRSVSPRNCIRLSKGSRPCPALSHRPITNVLNSKLSIDQRSITRQGRVIVNQNSKESGLVNLNLENTFMIVVRLTYALAEVIVKHESLSTVDSARARYVHPVTAQCIEVSVFT